MNGDARTRGTQVAELATDYARHHASDFDGRSCALLTRGIANAGFEADEPFFKARV